MSRVKNSTGLLLRVRQNKKSRERTDKTRRLGTMQTCCKDLLRRTLLRAIQAMKSRVRMTQTCCKESDKTR